MVFSAAGRTETQKAAPVPKATVEKTAFTFPAAIAGTVLTHTFTIQNTGDAPLHVLGVHTE